MDSYGRRLQGCQMFFYKNCWQPWKTAFKYKSRCVKGFKDVVFKLQLHIVHQPVDKPKLSWLEMRDHAERLAQGGLVDEWSVKETTFRHILLRVWMVNMLTLRSFVSYSIWILSNKLSSNIRKRDTQLSKQFYNEEK